MSEPSAVLDDVVTRRPVTCRVAVICAHSSPLDPPGTGDSGGMNVYVLKVAEQLAERGVASDIFTRATSTADPRIRVVAPGVRVIGVPAGPPRALHKDRLHALMDRFVLGVRESSTGPYEAIHAHYWLSGIAGAALSERWQIPLVMSFHTLARVKELASPSEPETAERHRGELVALDAAERVVAPTEAERTQLTELYGADPSRIAVVPPGVDLKLFHPGDRALARSRLGQEPDKPLVLFVGRLQPFKGAHIALEALAHLGAHLGQMAPDAKLVVAGGDSPRGSRGERMRLTLAARRLGISGKVRFIDPVPHEDLPDLYRAADVVVLPSASESFGLVALEAAACGTPVVATSVGGLRTVVRDGETGYLVPDRDPEPFAAALARILADKARRERLGRNAAAAAREFPWSRTAAGLLSVYGDLMACPQLGSALGNAG